MFLSIPAARRVIENSKGDWVSQVKIIKRKYEAKLEFPEGWGWKQKKTLCGRGMDIFWKNTNMGLGI